MRGLKLDSDADIYHQHYVAPFMGAWIEIKIKVGLIEKELVAPFMGAWIEIGFVNLSILSPFLVAPFMGAWIEIYAPPFFQHL